MSAALVVSGDYRGQVVNNEDRRRAAMGDVAELRDALHASFPASRELALVMTKLDEARMWLGEVRL